MCFLDQIEVLCLFLQTQNGGRILSFVEFTTVEGVTILIHYVIRVNIDDVNDAKQSC